MKKILIVLALATPPMFLMSRADFPALAAASQNSKLGDLSMFKSLANDTLVLVGKNDMAGAEKRITDFETAWDNAEPTLYPKDKQNWSRIDDAADAAISSLRAKSPQKNAAGTAVKGLVDALRQ